MSGTPVQPPPEPGLEPDPASEPARRRRSPSLAAALSFLWPGLGQAYAGASGRAAIQGLPMLAVVAGVVAVLVLVGPAVAFVHLFQPATALLAGVVIAGLGLWRAASIADASQTAARRPFRRQALAARLAVLGLILLTALVHAWAGSVIWSAYQAGVRMTHIPYTGAGPAVTM